MMRLISALIILLFFNFSKASTCSRFFESEFSVTSQYKTVDEFLLQGDLRERLMEIAKGDLKLKNFVMQLTSVQDYYFYMKLNQKIRGKEKLDYYDLGFSSKNEKSEIQNEIEMKQYLILSLMHPQLLTVEFERVFIEITHKIHNGETNKNSLLRISEKLDKIIQEYN